MNGNGDVEIALSDGSMKEHKYRISKGPAGEVDIDILFGNEADVNRWMNFHFNPIYSSCACGSICILLNAFLLLYQTKSQVI